MKRLLMAMTFLGMKLPPPPLHRAGLHKEPAASRGISRHFAFRPASKMHQMGNITHTMSIAVIHIRRSSKLDHTHTQTRNSRKMIIHRRNRNTHNVKDNVPWIVGHFRRRSSSHTLLGLRLHYELYFDGLLQNYD
jgi:hypothetical protein